MSLFSILKHSSRALQTAGHGIAVTSNNVANANTPGYAKQNLGVATQGTLRARGLLLGQGVKAEEVLSTFDRFSQGAVFGTAGRSAYSEARSQNLQSVETAFVDAAGPTGLVGALEGFFQSFDELELDPSNPALRANVLSKGAVVANLFSQAANDLTRRQNDADQQIGDGVQRVNQLSTQVATLNAQIVELEAAGQGAHDLRAHRTMLLEEMASLGPLTVSQKADGSAQAIFAGHAIVTGGTSRALSTVDDPATGFSQVHLQMGGSTINITSAMNRGSIGAAIDTRDTTLPTLIGQLDELAFEFTDQVNTAHTAGFGMDGVTGRDFFATPAALAGAAASMALSADVDGNPDAIGASSTLTGIPGDNGNATVLKELGAALSMSGATETFTGFLTSSLAQLGHEAAIARDDHLRGQLELSASLDLRDSVSGVSLEEEAMDLLRFQDAYQAAAKVMQTANEMLDELMNIV
ncbi:MAG: flagellar hook-associated protein FlgK [Proteobacteria bacterium]|nr:flagellar hook-associated protein FlgK [Pseudomonadota bacterium]